MNSGRFRSTSVPTSQQVPFAFQSCRLRPLEFTVLTTHAACLQIEIGFVVVIASDHSSLHIDFATVHIRPGQHVVIAIV
eukprot:5102078-Pleurochrysis_carterae.AAC.10